MKSAAIKRLKAYRKLEIQQPEKTHDKGMVLRNDWEEYIAHNEYITDGPEPEILIRVNECRSLYGDEDTPMGKTFSIVIVSVDQAVNDTAELAWVRTKVNIAKN